ncbi:MAG: Hsp20/alpha crystallin family protein [Ignavibacteriaceae bacterium]|nr:Hsp20/alpha crystallin family protein [Ignavibacteriaceae bacterium]
MTYIKFGPAGDFEAFNKKVHNFFDEFPNIGLDINYPIKPRTNYYTDEENVYLDVEIPGVKKEDIKISLKNNVLTVSGEKKDLSQKSKDGQIYKSERNFGPFTRSYQLPEGLNTDDIKASFEDGILKIVVSKTVKNQEQEKEIKIN